MLRAGTLTPANISSFCPRGNEAQRGTGVKDFSPASQDKAAWWLAQRDYQRNTGRPLENDLKSGKFDPRGLQNTWVSIRNLGADKWTKRYYSGATSNLAGGGGGGETPAGGGGGSSDTPVSSDTPKRPEVGAPPKFEAKSSSQQGGGNRASQQGQDKGQGEAGKQDDSNIPVPKAPGAPENTIAARAQMLKQNRIAARTQQERMANFVKLAQDKSSTLDELFDNA